MFQRATSLSELSKGQILPLELDGQAIIVYRHGEQVRACQRYCPHQHADLSEGLVSRGFLICAAHGWHFDAETGVHEMSEQTCLATYAVQVVGDEVQVDPTPIRNGAAPHE
jgi:nitrite reductase/ring-hydroxylating ferredoxin subunit